MKRKNIDPGHMLPVQPTFLIGTYNEDGTPNFAPITWVSKTYDESIGYLLIISLCGPKKTKLNAQRTKHFSVNLVSTDMLELVDYLGSTSGKHGVKDALSYLYSRADRINAPTLDQSRWVCECEIVRSVNTGESDTFFCSVKNVQLDERIAAPAFDGPAPGLDLTLLDPVIYSGEYHSIGKHLGTIGDFYPPQARP